MYGLPSGYEFGTPRGRDPRRLQRGERPRARRRGPRSRPSRRRSTSRSSPRPPDRIAPGRSAWPSASRWRATSITADGVEVTGYPDLAQTLPRVVRAQDRGGRGRASSSGPGRRAMLLKHVQDAAAAPPADLGGLTAPAPPASARSPSAVPAPLPLPRPPPRGRARTARSTSTRSAASWPWSWCRATSSTRSCPPAARAARPLPAPAPLPRLHRARLPVRLRLRGRPAPRPALRLRDRSRRARRLLFVLGVGYALHLPYLSFWKTALEATPAQKAALFACDALQVIAVTQLVAAGAAMGGGPALDRRRRRAAAVLVLAAGPFVWASGVSGAPAPPPRRLPRHGAGAVAVPASSPSPPSCWRARWPGRRWAARSRRLRRRRGLGFGLALMAAGVLLAIPLSGRVHFWGVSPAYALVRMGALLLLLLARWRPSRARWPGTWQAAGPARPRDAARRTSCTCSSCSAAWSAAPPCLRVHGTLGFGGAAWRWSP